MESKYNKPILRNAWRYIYARKSNCLVGVTGRVGTGKSHFAVKLGHGFDKNFTLEESLVFSVRELLDQSLKHIKYKGKPLDSDTLKKVPNIREWLKANMEYIKITPGKVVIFDEAGTGAYVREFFSKDNKTIAKMIQIWRLLRMLVLIVVPEDLRLADSTIIRFLDMEIKLLKVDYEKNEATCIAWAYRGWNKKTKEPIRQRVKGCRYGGQIHVLPLPEDLAKNYDDISKTYKIESLAKLRIAYDMDKSLDVGKTKTVWDDVQYVKEHPNKFKNEKGKITIALIRANLGVSLHKAEQIRIYVLKSL